MEENKIYSQIHHTVDSNNSKLTSLIGFRCGLLEAMKAIEDIGETGSKSYSAVKKEYRDIEKVIMSNLRKKIKTDNYLGLADVLVSAEDGDKSLRLIISELPIKEDGGFYQMYLDKSTENYYVLADGRESNNE